MDMEQTMVQVVRPFSIEINSDNEAHVYPVISVKSGIVLRSGHAEMVVMFGYVCDTHLCWVDSQTAKIVNIE